MTQADVERSPSANGTQGDDDQIIKEPQPEQPSADVPMTPGSSEDGRAPQTHAKEKFAALVLAVGGVLAVIRRRRRAKSARERVRRLPSISSMRPRGRRKGRSTKRAGRRKPRHK